MAIGSSIGSAKTRTFMNFVLVGQTCGKSHLLSAYRDGYFTLSYRATVGVDMVTKEINNGHVLICDIGAAETYSETTSMCFRRADAVFVCYNITDKKSFEGIASWISNCKLTEDVVIVMVGCMADLEEQRKVSLVTAKEKAKELFPNRNDIQVIETSAKSGQNVVQVFEFAISEVFNVRRKKSQDTTPAMQQKDTTSADCLLL